MLATGTIWLTVPETIAIEWNGSFQEGVCAKDAILFLCGRLGLDGGKYPAIEFSGSTVRGLSMQERMTLCNMTAELGAQTGLVAPDETTRNHLLAAGVPDASLADLAFWRSGVLADRP